MNYYISDHHFGHVRMNSDIDCRGFADVEAMDEYMIEQWNRKVKAEDEVFILGDLTAFTDGEQVNQLLGRLAGKKTLLSGNHDRYLEDPAFDKELVTRITPYLELWDNGKKVVLSHYPIMFYNEQYLLDQDGKPRTFMLYGHVHNGPDEQVIMEYLEKVKDRMKKNLKTGEPEPAPCQMINCFCMFSDYVPLTLEEWIRTDRARRKVAQREK